METSQNYEVSFCHQRKQMIGLISTRRRETYFTGRTNEELGSLISTTIATFLREGFRLNITQDNSKEEIDGFKIPRS